MTQKTYIGKGSIYVDNGSTGLVPLGNCSKLTLSVDEETKEILDYENAGGGLVNSLSRVSAVKLAITCHNFEADNLALAVRGAATPTVSVAPILDEALTARKGALLPTARLVNPAAPVTVTGPGGTPVYAAGADYAVKTGGIFIPTTSAIANAAALLVDYTPLADDLLQALTASGLNYRLVFDGLNEADSGKPAFYDFFKCAFAPSGFDLIGDDFAGFELAATVLKDASKAGLGVSQYFRARIG
ncbi:MAG: hypothetical protein KGZ43_10030 [Sulfuritalea sp.]|nr:hypothetical protein [Sulfuritalea sp.]